MPSSLLSSDLLFTLGGLLLGPVLFGASRRREEVYGLLDGFVLVGVAGLILAEVLPETVKAAGLWALAAAAGGFALPFAIERRLSLLPFSPNTFFRWLMILGLLLHQVIDGVALSERLLQGGGGSLRLAVALHQAPKGFFIWGMVGAAMGARVGSAVIASLCLVTVGGFVLGDRLSGALAARPLWLFQAFVGGGLLHVIVHHVPWRAAAASASCPGTPGTPGEAQAGPRFNLWSGVGAALSLAGVFLLAFWRRSESAAAGLPVDGFLGTFVHLVVDNAWSILLGFAAAGIFQAFLPRAIFSWFRGKGRFSQALRGVALGIPLPVCSCGVVPVYLSLLRKGVPPAAALAFLIATPEIGIDSFFLSWSLLGPEITLIRLGMAFVIALAVGFTLARTFERIAGSGDLESLALPEDWTPPATFRGKLREAARYGFREIVDHTGAWLLLGIVIAAVLDPYADEKWFRQFPRGADVLVLSLVGLPLYVCASAATPLAAVLLKKGLSTGAVLSFLITGPSTNVTTFGILKRFHGIKGAVLFAAAVYGFTIAVGFAINSLIPPIETPLAVRDPAHQPGAFAWTCAAALALLFLDALFRLGPRGFLATVSESLTGPPGEPRLRHRHHGHDHAPAHAHAAAEGPGGA